MQERARTTVPAVVDFGKIDLGPHWLSGAGDSTKRTVDPASFQNAAQALVRAYEPVPKDPMESPLLATAVVQLAAVLEKERIALTEEIRSLLAEDGDLFGDEFDLMRLFGIEDDEVRHTQFLGWLLDPGAPHALGRRCLRLLLEKACGSLPPQDLVEEDYRVYPERGNDLGIPDIEVSGRSFIVLVENKIFAKESAGLALDERRPDLERGHGQYRRYLAYGDGECQKRGIASDRFFPVLLCINPKTVGEAPERFRRLKWGTFAKAARKLLEDPHPPQGPARDIVARYLLSVRRLACPLMPYGPTVRMVLSGTGASDLLSLSLVRGLRCLAERWSNV